MTGRRGRADDDGGEMTEERGMFCRQIRLKKRAGHPITYVCYDLSHRRPFLVVSSINDSIKGCVRRSVGP